MNRLEGSRPLVAIIACLAAQVCVGILYMWSVFQQSVIDYYGWQSGDTALISSFMVLGFVTGSLAAGFLQSKLHLRWVIAMGGTLFCGGIFIASCLQTAEPWMYYLSYSMISGLGCGFVYNGVLFGCQKWLPHRRGLASGISVCAFGLSVMIFTPLANRLLESFTVLETFRIFSILFFVIIIGATFFVRTPNQEYLDKLNLPVAERPNQGLRPGQAVKDMRFWCIALTLFFINGTWNIVMPIIKPLCLLRDLTPAAASLAVMFTGAFNAGGRFLVAACSDKLGRAKSVIAMAVITVVAAVFLIFATGNLFIVTVWVVAFTYGGPAPVLPAMMADIFGPKYAAANYGIAMMFLGFSAVFFNKLSAVISTSGAATGDYTAIFTVAAATCIIPIVLMSLIGPLSKGKKGKITPRG